MPQQAVDEFQQGIGIAARMPDMLHFYRQIGVVYAPPAQAGVSSPQHLRDQIRQHRHRRQPLQQQGNRQQAGGGGDHPPRLAMRAQIVVHQAGVVADVRGVQMRRPRQLGRVQQGGQCQAAGVVHADEAAAEQTPPAQTPRQLRKMADGAVDAPLVQRGRHLGRRHRQHLQA
ncbi:hypothetical protein C2134_05355 [Chromobacterium sinusclupearum]|uniref:Uncharacterized protein n=1 Tax=Chromobacterium sinusclupearum TaxID=2077146 RepID=A0A2K4MRB2_9NEIS|nr:hypothetical protein C2134_05355 [Chromobacterium sinusclupearum]